MAHEVADYILLACASGTFDTSLPTQGDGINGLVAAFGRADNNPKFVQARHEEMAAFQARQADPSRRAL